MSDPLEARRKCCSDPPSSPTVQDIVTFSAARAITATFLGRSGGPNKLIKFADLNITQTLDCQFSNWNIQVS